MELYDITGEKPIGNTILHPLIPTNSIIQTCAEVYTLYDSFVNDGFATKELIATVNNLPMYRYDFSAANRWASGESNEEDESGEKLYSKKQVLCFSGLHGDEKGSVLYLYEFFKKVCYDPNYSDYFAEYDFHVVPIGNPYGYNADIRNNADNININRIDQSSGTIEAQALIAEIDKRSYDLFIDFHNAYSDATKADVTGALSFANDMPNDKCIIGWELYLKAGQKTSKVLRDYWNMPNNNGRQDFLPWQGTTNLTFRNYGYTHEYNGETVGSPVSACFEVSMWCYTYSTSTTKWNEKALIVGTTILDYMFREYLDELGKMK